MNPFVYFEMCQLDLVTPAVNGATQLVALGLEGGVLEVVCELEGVWENEHLTLHPVDASTVPGRARLGARPVEGYQQQGSRAAGHVERLCDMKSVREQPYTILWALTCPTRPSRSCGALRALSFPVRPRTFKR